MGDRSERWRRVEALFHHARNLDFEERNAWLREVCADDRALENEIAALLRADDTATQKLAPPTHADFAVFDEETTFVGQTVGGCRLDRLIAEGGMGAVYAGHQAALRRPVAVKLVKSGLGSSAARQRFDYEARVVASLRHPGIAQVHDFGVWEPPAPAPPVPYLVMELIPDARSLTQYADAAGLDLPSRLALFCQVCEAVAFAHQRGVIHRDLKPANILVDGSGAAKVIDFGVARGTDAFEATRGFETQAGSIVGTLPYMSPEQVGSDPSDVDIRADVYALGVILYELACGRRPLSLEGLSLADAMDAIREQIPDRPALLRPELRGDLETVMMTALAKERDRRYGSAATLREDLRRLAEGLPIVARAPSLGYQLRLLARRHRTLFIAASVTVLALAAAAVVSTVFAFRAEDARHAEVARRREAAHLARTGDDFARWVIDEHLSDLTRLSGSGPPLVRLARRIKTYLDDLASVADLNLELRGLMARAYLRVGRAQADSAWADRPAGGEAIDSFRRAEALLAALVEDTRGNREDEINLLNCRLFLAASDLATDRRAEAARAIADLRQRVAQLGGDRDRDLRELRHHAASVSEEAARRAGDWKESLRFGTEKLRLAAGIAQDRWLTLADARWGLALSCLRLGRHAPASSHIEAGLVALGDRPERADVRARISEARLLHLRADLQASSRKLAAARGSHDAALALWTDLLDEDPGNHSLAHARALSLEGLGAVLYALGDFPAARKILTECLAVRDVLSPKDVAHREARHARTVAACTLIDVLLRTGDLEGARGHLRAARRAAEDLMSASAAPTPLEHALLADVLQREGTWHLRNLTPDSGVDPIVSARRAITLYQKSLTHYARCGDKGEPEAWIATSMKQVEQLVEAAEEVVKKLQALGPGRDD